MTIVLCIMTDRLSYLWRGLRYGALAGLVAAEIYIVGLTLVALGATANPESLYVLVMGQMAGAVPAVIVGSISGALIGLVFALLNPRFSIKAGAMLGLAITVVLIAFVILYLLFLGWLAGSTYVTEVQIDFQVAAIVLPIVLLCLVSGAWVGGKLMSHAQLDAQAKPISTKTRLTNP